MTDYIKRSIYRRMNKHTKPNQLDLLREEMNKNKCLHGKVLQKAPAKSQSFDESRQWGLYSHQKKIELKQEILTSKVLKQNEQSVTKQIKMWEYGSNKSGIITKILPSNMFYPPSCSGNQMAYCKSNDTIYVYGGISCSSSLNDGIKQYFYKFCEGRWTEIKPESVYNPTPRYGHTFTAYQKDLILFGGVSEYKQKLKDRCFYTDCSVYSTTKNNWKLMETGGQNVKTRKNHAACIYNKYYIVFGGLNQSEQTINEVSWVNLECKKSRWKSFALEGRFNHKMVVIQPQSGKDFLCIFGGRNSQSEIVNTMFCLPFVIYEGELSFKDAIFLNHTISPRETPIMTAFLQGFIILGGVDENCDIVEDCWYYNGQKQVIEEVKLTISFGDLRGARGCYYKDKIYILAGNSTNYKAIQILSEK